MPDKYSSAKCEQYSRRLAAHLCDQHFNASPESTLDGPAILGFTPIRQVNLLVVRQLLQQWQAEISRLRSPYFDFEAPAVQTALLQFQNTLSRYIRLTRPAFEPLLAQAIADALRLAADPTSAFEHLYLTEDSDNSPAKLSNLLRYLDLNKEFFNSFIATLPAEAHLSSDVVASKLRLYQDSTYHSQLPVQQLVTALSSLMLLTEADLWEDGPAASYSSSIALPTPVITSVSGHATAPIVGAALGALPATNDTSAPNEDTNVSKRVRIPAIADAPLHEKLKATQLSATPLAATLRATLPPPVPLSERSVPKVETLREAISINQRFSFINELFNGENMEYHAAIQHLEALPDYEKAHLYITQNLFQRYDWGRKEEHVNKLLKLVERKFSHS
jgi:hypothetical protein